MKGRVLRSTGSWYVVELEDGSRLDARLRGKMRITSGSSTNPVAVGDWVELDLEDTEEGAATIADIVDRKNYISRESPKHQYSRHIIAANMDQAFVIATISNPRTSTGFIDRFLVTAEAFDIPAHIILNKQDVLSRKDLQKQEMYVEAFTSAGYPVHLVSALEHRNVEELKTLMTNKVTLLAGHSGVGKSTLVNAIEPSLNLRTAEISSKYAKGTHTTTFAEMIPLSFGGYIIDTPGIKEFGILDMEPQEVGHYFPEIRKYLQDCRFNNCLHFEEPGCAVRDAVEHGLIHFERYKNYTGIVLNAQERPKY